MNELVGYLQKKGCSKSSIASYIRSRDHFLTWAESRHLVAEYATYSELIDYVAHLKKRSLHPRTIQGYMMGVAHYFESLTLAGIITVNPAKYLDIRVPGHKKLYPLLTRVQLEGLYMGFDLTARRNTKPTARASAIRHRIATGLMVYQGLEATTLSGLKTTDVDVMGGTIKISRGRTYNERKLGLQAVQIIELDRYINQTRKVLTDHFKQDTPQLLVTGYSHYRDAHKKLLQRLKHDHPYLQSGHQIRASVITHWLKQYNLREVQYMAGHRKIRSTESYQRNDTEGLQLEVDRFHPLG